MRLMEDNKLKNTKIVVRFKRYFRDFNIIALLKKIYSLGILSIYKIPKGFNIFRHYINIWLLMSKNSFMMVLAYKKVFLFFLIGKLVRLLFFTAFIYFLVEGSQTLAGYSVYQVVFFFLTFNVIEVISQFLFREVYRFRSLIVTGDFDLVLIKPVSPLFRALMGGADVIDFVTIPIIFVAAYYVGTMLNPSLLSVILYLFLIINGVIISASFYIVVLSLAIITFEIDHTVMIFRDLGYLGRLPVDIYKQPLRMIITYIIPIGIMVTIPAKALMGLITPLTSFLITLFGFIAIFISINVWKLALRKYSSASS